MKKYKIFGFLFLILLFTVFIPTTNYKAFAENEKESTTKTTATHKATTVKKVKKSKAKKKKKAKTSKTKKVVGKIKTPTTTTASTTTTTAATYSLAVVATHNSATSCWTAINGNVYDVTSWISQHPGGEQAILSLCGKDGTQAFNNQHGGQAKPAAELINFLIGTLQ